MMDKLNDNWLEFHEKSKFRLVLHLLYFFAGLMAIVTIVNFFNKHFSAMPNFIAVGMCVLGLVILRISKNYRLVGAICAILTFGIVSGSFLFLKATHYLTPMWMIVNIMFTFFVLGKTFQSYFTTWFIFMKGISLQWNLFLEMTLQHLYWSTPLLVLQLHTF
jgi:two-component system, sensor histidine kinase PdtaS